MIITNTIQVEDNFLFKMVEMQPAQLPPMRTNSSCLAAGMTGTQMAATGAAGMARWTGVNFFDISLIIRDLCPRYDSQGNYLGSLPDLEVARHKHACASFFSNQGEQVSLKKLLNSILLSKRGGWSLGVSTTIMAMNRAQKYTCHQTTNGQEGPTFQGCIRNNNKINKSESLQPAGHDSYHNFHCHKKVQ